MAESRWETPFFKYSIMTKARKKGKKIITYFFKFLAKPNLFTFLASKITFFWLFGFFALFEEQGMQLT